MSNKNKGRKKKNLGSYPYLTVVFSITLALFTLGIFGLIFIHGASLSEKIKNNHEVQVFLNNNLSQAQQEHISTIIRSKEYSSSIDKSGTETVVKSVSTSLMSVFKVLVSVFLFVSVVNSTLSII